MTLGGPKMATVMGPLPPEFNLGSMRPRRYSPAFRVAATRLTHSEEGKNP